MIDDSIAYAAVNLSAPAVGVWLSFLVAALLVRRVIVGLKSSVERG